MKAMSSSMTAFGPIGNFPRNGKVELHELNLVLPHLAQEIFEHLARELFPRTAPIAEAERGEPCVVGDRQGLAVSDAEDGAEAAVGQARLPAVGDIEVVMSKGQRAKPICLHLASSIWSLVGTVL